MIWILRKLFYRLVQYCVRLIIRILNFKDPILISGNGSISRLPEAVSKMGVRKVLIVSGRVVTGLGMLDGLLDGLKKNNIEYVVFNNVRPNPTIDNVEEALTIYEDSKCQGIIAFGGGSPMDCAKIIAARSTNKKKQVGDMRGVLKVKKNLPPVFAVPTTAGTGSETTVAAVITDTHTHEKFGISDPKLMPAVAVLDPELTVGLPPHITAATGMDALTHAIEAYVGLHGTGFTDKKAEQAVKMIFENLEKAYDNPAGLEARSNMLLASYFAGQAFTRAYVGYVHAIAHGLGGIYDIPHGLANAIVLPYVLEYYGKSIGKKLARLAVIAGIGSESEPDKELSQRLIYNIRRINENMNIPKGIKELKKDDIELIAARALKESNPQYPVPRIMNYQECCGLLLKLIIE